MITTVSVTPQVGQVDAHATVEWHLGYDIAWVPSTNDELRLLTTGGVLVSRVSLRDAQRKAPKTAGGSMAGMASAHSMSPVHSFAGWLADEPGGVDAGGASTIDPTLTLRDAVCKLPTASFGGSFVIAFIDCTVNFRRVYTVPYRVIGPEYLSSKTLHLQHHDPLIRFSNGNNTAAIKQEPSIESIDITRTTDSVLGPCTASSIDADTSTTTPLHTCYPYERLTVRFDAAAIANLPTQLGRLPPASSDAQPQRGALPKVDAANSSLRFVVCKAHLGDNLGFSEYGAGVYDHCVSVARVPAEAFDIAAALPPIASNDGSGAAAAAEPTGPRYATVELMAPPAEGDYEVRLMFTPMCGLPYSIACSDAFRVCTAPPRATRGRLFGSIKLSRLRCIAGEPLTLSYHIHSADTHLLSRLDTVGFFPYGRPEVMEHPETHHLTVMEAVGRKTLSVRAPTEPGVFEAAFYAFLEQQPVLITEPLTVLEPKFDVALNAAYATEQGMQPRTTLNGKAVWSTANYTAVFDVSVPLWLHHPRDRLALLDEGANVVYQASVVLEGSPHVVPGLYDESPDAYEGCCVLMRSGTVEVRHSVPGKYTVHYYSASNARFMYQAPLYLELTTDARHLAPVQHLPTGAISVLAVVPEDDPIEVHTKKEGVDAREGRLQLMDMVCIYAAGAPDAVCTAFLDDTAAQPYLAGRHLRGRTSDCCFLPSLRELRAMIERSLHASGGSEWEEGARLATSPVSAGYRYRRDVLPPSTQQQQHRTQHFFNAELLAALRATTKFSVRYMAAVDGYFQRVCVSEAFVEVLPRSRMPAAYRTAPLRQVAVRELASLSHRLTTAMTDGLTSSTVTPVALSRRAAAAQGYTSASTSAAVEAHQSAGVGGALRILRDDTHEFRGAVLAPNSCVASDPMVVTYHVTSGLPRGSDRLLLLSVGGSTAITECPLSMATDARADLTLGTVLLRPPVLEGSYVVAYYSELYGGIVLLSEPVRVMAPPDAGNVPVGSTHTLSRRSSLMRPRTIGQPLSHGALEQQVSTGCSTPSVAALPMPSYAAPHGGSVCGASPRRLPRCKVLIVGVSYLQQPHELKGPLNDVDAFKSVAQRYLIDQDANRCYPSTGAPASGTDHLVRVLHEATSDAALRPTADNLLKGFAWLLDDAMEGDQLVFYFSGAGSVMSDGSRCLLPVDFDWQLRQITAKDIRDHLIAKAHRAVAVSVFLDCCYYTTRLESFRRSELRLLSAGQEDSHAGWGGLKRRRAYQGVGVAPWRCVPPPRGTHEENPAAQVTEPPEHYGPLLLDASTLTNNAVQAKHLASGDGQDALSPLAVVYEAARSAHAWPDGAWDVFLRESSVTKGLFTHYLCARLEAEIEQRDAARRNGTAPPPPLRWFELHETMMRDMEGMSYRQRPRLWLGAPDTLSAPIRCVGST